jgi:ribosomal-protein-alanine N-acetyltransferase
MSFQFEIIETPRLLLKKISPPEYIYIMDNYTDEELMEFLDFTPELVARDRERRAQGVSSFLCSFIYFVIVDKETGKTIGSCGYYRYYPQHFRGEVGYILTDESYRQRGLIKEVMPYVLAYGFNEMNLTRIEAIVGPNNVPSLRIMELFGFTREGLMREHYHINEKNEDSVIFSLLKSEYKSDNR